MDVANENQITHFQRRLAETMAWCNSQDWSADPAKGLRTALFDPSEQTSPNQIPSFLHYKQTPQQRQRNVELLTIKRTAILQKQGSLLPFEKPLTSGRLLAFTPDGTLSDGAAAVATYGFFDDDNVPAWDTWIWYVTNDFVSKPEHWCGGVTDSYLLSWVPDSLVEVVASGIWVNPEECIRWATDLDTPFIQQLKEARLVW